MLVTEILHPRNMYKSKILGVEAGLRLVCVNGSVLVNARFPVVESNKVSIAGRRDFEILRF